MNGCAPSVRDFSKSIMKTSILPSPKELPTMLPMFRSSLTSHVSTAITENRSDELLIRCRSRSHCHACGEGAKSDAKKPEGAAPLAGIAAVAGLPLRMRPEGDIEAIGALCKMAGCPDKAAEFLTKKKPNGQYFSVADVSEELTAARVIESERSMITSHVNPNQGAVGSLQEIEAQATSYARQNRGKETPNLYAESGTTKLTKERAYALMLEEHPEVYGAFVAQHNAKGLIATLERAGVRLAR